MLIQNVYHVEVECKGADFIGKRQIHSVTNMQTLSFIY